MKKTQRSRLAQLKSKDQASLSEAEKAELVTLEALSVANPDASKDEDDTKPLTAAEFLGRLTSAFKDKADLVAENTRLKARVAELERNAAAATVQPAAQELQAAKDAQAAAAGALATAETNLSAANAFLASVAAFLGIKTVAGTPAELSTALTARMNLLAGEQLATLGFPAGGIPASTATADAPSDFNGKMAEYNKLSGREREEYYARVIAPEFAKSQRN